MVLYCIHGIVLYAWYCFVCIHGIVLYTWYFTILHGIALYVCFSGQLKTQVRKFRTDQSKAVQKYQTCKTSQSNSIESKSTSKWKWCSVSGGHNQFGWSRQYLLRYATTAPFLCLLLWKVGFWCKYMCLDVTKNSDSWISFR